MAKYLDSDGIQYLWSQIDQEIKANKSTFYFGNITSNSTTLFTADVPGVTSLYNGLAVYIKNNGNQASASGITLNVNGLGAKPIYSSQASASAITTQWAKTYTALLVYNETRVTNGCWDYFYGYDSNSNTIGYQLRTNSQTLPMKAKTVRYRLLFTSADNAGLVPANTSTSTNATTSRTACQEKINPFGPIYYYGTTAAVDVGDTPAATSLWQQYTLSLGYSWAAGAALTMTISKPVYLKCVPQSDGSAIIDNSNKPWVQDLPTEEDGNIYIYLGNAYAATTIELVPYHPVYEYKNGAIRLWTNNNELTLTDSISSDDSTVAASAKAVKTAYDLANTANTAATNLPTASTSQAGIVQLSNTSISRNATRALSAGWGYYKEQDIAAAADTASQAYETITQKTRIYVSELPQIPNPILKYQDFNKNAIFCISNNSVSGDFFDTYICISNQQEIRNVSYISENDPTLIQNLTHNITNVWLKMHNDTWNSVAFNGYWLAGKLHFYSGYDDEEEEWIELDNSPLISSTGAPSTEDLTALCAELNTLDYFYVDTEPNRGNTDCDIAFTYNFNSYWQKLDNESEGTASNAVNYFGYNNSFNSSSMKPGTSVSISSNSIQSLGNALSGYTYPEIGDYLIDKDGYIAQRVAGSGNTYTSGDFVFRGVNKQIDTNGKGEIYNFPSAAGTLGNAAFVFYGKSSSQSSVTNSFYNAYTVVRSMITSYKINYQYGLKFFILNSNKVYDHFYTVTDTANGLLLPSGTLAAGDFLYLKGTIDGKWFTPTGIVSTSDLSTQTASNSDVYWNYGRIASASGSNYYLELYQGQMWQVISYDGENLTVTKRIIPYTGLADILKDLADYNFA